MKQYLYIDVYDDNEIKVLTVGQPSALFNEETDRRKKNAEFFKKPLKLPTLEKFIATYDSFDPSAEGTKPVCDLSPLARKWCLQQAVKCFEDMPWVDTFNELKNVYYEKVDNLHDTIDFSEFY
ncbi:hypothetical protein [Anaerostipes sp. Marseille-Q3525]|uniref:hypothetical protein n=1 Tax=Anaerostipes sp. Marseille-Q3525 TaxID=2758418 RepID=UPI001BA6844F|nr:hypothetical protein [Anaerostipes sp. Marseille-Q3525]MBR9960893.1 hypothetical protein [Anaerostipes sp. Marseille-Q3525]